MPDPAYQRPRVDRATERTRAIISNLVRGTWTEPMLAEELLVQPTLEGPDQDAELIWLQMGECDRWIAAARAVKAQLETEMRDNVELHGRIRFGDHGYYTGRSSTTKLIDPEGLVAWLGDDFNRTVNPNNVRITDVKAIAKKRGLDPDVILDTFYEVTIAEDAELELKSIIPKRAKWVAALDHGERKTSHRPSTVDNDTDKGSTP